MSNGNNKTLIRERESLDEDTLSMAKLWRLCSGSHGTPRRLPGSSDMNWQCPKMKVCQDN